MTILTGTPQPDDSFSVRISTQADIDRIECADATAADAARPFVANAGDEPVRAGAGDPDDKLIDLGQVAHSVSFVWRAVRRHRLLAASTFLIVFALIAVAAEIWPKTYHVDATILTQPNGVMNLSTGPSIQSVDVPTRAAAEIILGYENLVANAKQADLVKQWDRTRAPILRAKDAVFRHFFGLPAPDDKLEALVGLLEKRMAVRVTQEGAITISIDWSDGLVGCALVDAAVQNFLSLRRSSETAAITESISILQRSAESLQADIDVTAAELEAARANRPRTARAKSPPTLVGGTQLPAGTPPLSPMVERSIAGSPPEALFRLADLKRAADVKQQEIAHLEESQRQQLRTLQARLDAARTIYTEGHPTVAALARELALASREPPELLALRSEEQKLQAQYQLAVNAAQKDELKLAVPPADAPGTTDQKPTPRSSEASRAPLPDPPLLPLDDVPNPASLRLRLELGQLANIRERITGARIELAAAQASFDDRYTLLRPAKVPRRPAKPDVFVIMAAGAFGALGLGVCAAVGRDVLRRRRAGPENEATMEFSLAAGNP